MRAVRFADVTSQRRHPPSWVAGAASPALEAVTLSPPRVPRSFGDHPLEEDLETPECDESVTRLSVAADARDEAPSAPTEPPAAPPERKSDTFIDEIAPAVDDEAFATISAAVREIAGLRREIFEQSEAQIVELAGIIARRVVAREVSINPRLVRGLVREGLDALGAHDRVLVRIGTGFGDVRRELEADLRATGTACDVTVDSSLDTWGCRVETELGSVDESIETRLEALIQALASGDAAGR